MRWHDLKRKGSDHYKAKTIEPIDLYKSGEMLQDFAIGNIIKYAFRNRSTCNLADSNRMGHLLCITDMKKIIHYSEMLISIEEEAMKEADERRIKCSKSTSPHPIP